MVKEKKKTEKTNDVPYFIYGSDKELYGSDEMQPVKHCGVCGKTRKTGCVCGREPEYTEDELVGWGNEYIEACIDSVVDGKQKVDLPKVAGLALYIRKASDGKYSPSRTQMYELGRKFKGFADILENVNLLQEDRLLNNGLSGAYQSPIAKLVLGKHGYKEQQDITSDNRSITDGALSTTHEEDKEVIKQFHAKLKDNMLKRSMNKAKEDGEV